MANETNQTQDKLLDKSLQAYRVITAPANSSWKRRFADGEMSAELLYECDKDSSKRFLEYLSEIPVSVHKSSFAVGGSKERQITLKDWYSILTNKKNKDIEKLSRKIIYSTDDGSRPLGDDAFLHWNGLQIIDIDIKDRNNNKIEGLAEKLKPVLFNSLKNCNWFLGATLSASGKSLHIYTKIIVPDEYEGELEKRKLLYFTNFRHKFSFVYIALLNGMDQYDYDKEDIGRWMDVSMMRPQQGAYIGYDPKPAISTNFFEDFIYVSFDNVEDLGHPDLDWVTIPELKVMFSRLENSIDTNESNPDIKILNKDDSKRFPDPNFKQTKVHYKHNERWRLANTLVQICGLREGEKYMRAITSNVVPDKEIKADCNTAFRHKKPYDIWAINTLNKMHGFHIKVEVDKEDIGASDIVRSMQQAANPNRLVQSKNYMRFDINEKQYLTDILGPILHGLGRISLIEAGPGLGKTEMVKKLVDAGKKVMMILPFTSVAKSKVEQSDQWYCSYGGRRPKLDVPGGLALTVDKFSQLNIADIALAGFDYIFLDESHLLFMSEYRPVMSKVVDLIKNTQVPIVLMSGTPTGELVFFPDLVHIHVVKTETRQKELLVNLVDTTSDLLYHMCRAMARDIANGHRILFPSNEGTTFSKRIKAGIEYFLQQEHRRFEPINLKYYKKSNLGEDFMDGVNIDKTIADTEVVMCTTYMGCGVDIEDKYNFRIYFGDLCTPAECDQWCNRLRNNDLIVRMFVAKNDADGNPRHIETCNKPNFGLDEEEIKQVHSLLRLYNSMIERNKIESMYNPIIASFVNDNRYIRYDEVKCKYYIDKLAYQVVMFERKYRAYAEQLGPFMKGMECYGYNVPEPIDLGPFQVSGSEIFRDLKNLVKLASDDQLQLNTAHVQELLDLMTDDRLSLYEEAMKGRWVLKKGKDWKEDMSNPDEPVMWVKSVEVFEKVVPVFRSLMKHFEASQVREIFEYCRTNTRYNFAAINRMRILANIIYADEDRRLDEPIKKFTKDAWEFADVQVRHKTEIDTFIKEKAEQYATDASTEDITIIDSMLTIKKLIDKFTNIFKCLVNKSRPDKQGMVNLERQELLWKRREFYGQDKNEHIFIMADFMDQHIESIDSKVIDVPESEIQEIEDVPF